MAIQPIIRMGHPLLRQRAQEVDVAALHEPGFEQLLTDLKDTLADAGGIGLAAPQIGVPLRVAIIDLPGGPSRYGDLPSIAGTVFINPQLEILDAQVAGYWEGCLSVPGLRGYVERPQALQVTAHNDHGERIAQRFDGFAATVVQHEFDHLDGVLYVDLIKDTRLLMFEPEYEQYVLSATPQTAEPAP